MARMVWLLALAAFAAAPARARHPELLLPASTRPPCQGRNMPLSNFMRAAVQESGELLLPHTATDLEAFIGELKIALDRHHLQQRPIEHIFSDAAPFHPTCAGMWAEFGVASGYTANLAARFKRDHCSPSCTPVHGFDTFTGLPEDWKRDDNSSWGASTFDQQGLPTVEPNVHLVKGLFNTSLPVFLRRQAVFAPSDEVVSYLHIDCDLYAGARDALTLLSDRLVVGTVLVFDDLLNYQYFRDHEVKALWEWLQRSGSRLLPLGVLGRLPGKDTAVQLDWASEGAAPHLHQSAAFVIAQQAPRAA